jgi:hypothetical protein
LRTKKTLSISKTQIFLFCRNMKFEVNFGKNKAGEEVKPFQEPPETLEGYTQVNCLVNLAPDLYFLNLIRSKFPVSLFSNTKFALDGFADFLLLSTIDLSR